jgi:hypothetical protein
MGGKHRLGGLFAMLKQFLLSIALLAVFTLPVRAETGGANAGGSAGATTGTGSPVSPHEARLALLEGVSALTGIPWTYLAACDQYERAMTRANPKTREAREGLIAIHYSDRQWAGDLNPDKSDTDPASIAFFGGIGMDGDGDGKADRANDADVLYTFARRLLMHGTGPDDFRIALWETYHNSRAVDRIMQFVRIYETFGTLALEDHVFPLPLDAHYTYRSTWGAKRGWGGLRIHEGTDIFAGYGVPVRSTCYGIVEVKGWNRYGGWRVGIRSIHNVYHYYAHLSGFHQSIEVGRVVKPGDVIGWVGSSGYGRQGTSGKFPPHLHYGLYRDNGYFDWSFDPYPKLRQWEKEEQNRRRGK